MRLFILALKLLILKNSIIKAFLEEKIWLKNIPAAEGEALFFAESNNPLLDLYEYNGDRKIKKCAICSKKFIATGNTKTCSSRKCSTMLRGMKKTEKDQK